MNSDRAENNNIYRAAAAVLCAAALILMLIYLCPVQYAMPAADDFSFANSAAQLIGKGHSPLAAAFLLTADRWLSWGGVYTAFWTGYIVLGTFGVSITAIRFILGATLILLCTALLRLLLICTRKMRLRSPIITAFAMMDIILWAGLGSTTPKESLYWFPGAFNYMLPLAAGLYGICAYLDFLPVHESRGKRMEKGTGALCTLSCILAFLSCGGVLPVAAFTCAAYLFIMLHTLSDKGRKRKEKRLTVLPFAAAFTGALLNAGAPGNFVRRAALSGQSAGSGEAAGTVLTGSIVVFVTILKILLHRAGCWALLLLLVFLERADFKKENSCRQPSERDDYSYLRKDVYRLPPGLAVLYSVLTLLALPLPVVAGYGSSELTDRTEYILCCMYIMVILGAVWYVGTTRKTEKDTVSGAAAEDIKKQREGICPLAGKAAGKNHKKAYRRKSSLRAVSAFLVFVCIAGFWRDCRLNLTVPCRILQEGRNGQMQQFAVTEEKILDEILASPEEDVVITQAMPYSYLLKSFDITEDPDDWSNAVMAQWAGRKSLRLDRTARQ